jgi:hypothetical protein
MARLYGRFLFVRHPFAAAVRLREIEGEIREILRTYPDLASTRSNDHSRSRSRRIRRDGREYRRRW